MADVTTADSTQNAAGSYTTVNGLRLYHEIHGSGRPLILLHGGVGASEMFGSALSALAQKRQVVAVHLQGHGRTTDIDRPLSFQSMADDVAALTKILGIGRADFMGYSLGGGVALQSAIRHPDVVRKLVVVSAPVKREGFYPEVLDGMAQMGPETAKFMRQSPLYTLYPGVDWAKLFTKLRDLLKQDYDWSSEVAAIKSPVMAVFADADAVRAAHVMEIFELLGGGRRDAGLDGAGRPTARLAILPGMTHYDVLTFPGLDALVTAFLDAPMPAES